MGKFVRFLSSHIFVTMSGLAALIHSVWSLDVAFAGAEVSLATDPINAVFRKFVAFLIASAIDVGQIKTSMEIKEGQRSKSKYFAFFSFAFATYLLQFYYMSHHTPNLSLAPGVREEWVWVVKLISDACIWVIPALLPASTLLYTFSQKKPEADMWADHRKDEMERQFKAQELHLEQLRANALAEIEAMKVARLAEVKEVRTPLPQPTPIPQITSGQDSPYGGLGNGRIRVTCPNCTNFVKDYDNIDKASSGLRSHGPYCKHNRQSPVVIESPSEVEVDV